MTGSRQWINNWRGLTIFAIAFLAGGLGGGKIEMAAQAQETCAAGLVCLDQGWSERDRTKWYRTSQGSRLLPLSWALALEEAGRESPFFADENMRALGYLPAQTSAANPHGLPIGFVVDEESSNRADIMCETFPETCNGFLMRKPWLGMTCSACHTNDIEYDGSRIRIEGAPTLADFQSFLERILAALESTAADEAKFDRFARSVLGAELSVPTRIALRAQLIEQIAWQTRLIDANHTDLRYGYGRLDAQGHILNKVAAVGGGAPMSGPLASDAPASYPHIWNTAQQDKIQWNGIARNILNIPLFGKNTDIGALVRNTSEVIGVFAHIEINPRWMTTLLGYKSSLRVDKMVDLEQQLARLQSPRWPEDVLPPIDWDSAERGRALFETQCARCHADLASDDLTTPIKVPMQPIREGGTDIFLACNTFLHWSNAGKFEGRRPFVVKGDRIDSEDFTRDMLTNAAVGAVIGRSDELVGSLFDDIFRRGGSPESRESGAGFDYLPGVTDPVKKEIAQACLTSQDAGLPGDESILAYKARPLNGIWATAPYLHNGSVPTLYDLLLPSPLRVVVPAGKTLAAPGPGNRPASFHVGSRVFDPTKVGFSTQPAELLVRSDGEVVETFEFKVYGSDGSPVPGNYNSGHDYGTEALSEQQRWELVEYLKTL
ncbi:MAG: hypothetical protein KL801_17925 [Mesorhizobium sp.]|nr:hypothetical protein [Mesorhizobium sp.]